MHPARHSHIRVEKGPQHHLPLAFRRKPKASPSLSGSLPLHYRRPLPNFGPTGFEFQLLTLLFFELVLAESPHTCLRSASWFRNLGTSLKSHGCNKDHVGQKIGRYKCSTLLSFYSDIDWPPSSLLLFCPVPSSLRERTWTRSLDFEPCALLGGASLYRM